MQKKMFIVISVAVVFIMSFCLDSFTQSETPVRIEFDKNSERIDLVTGEILPLYTQAQRGSFQFFNSRLDKPDKGFWYYFDGRRFQNVERVALIRKMPSLGAWAILSSAGRYDNPDDRTVRTNPISICEIEHHAVSFIPLNPDTHQPDRRVYLLIDDMYLIQWAQVDHWMATKTQEELESEKGTKY